MTHRPDASQHNLLAKSVLFLVALEARRRDLLTDWLVTFLPFISFQHATLGLVSLSGANGLPENPGVFTDPSGLSSFDEVYFRNRGFAQTTYVPTSADGRIDYSGISIKNIPSSDRIATRTAPTATTTPTDIGRKNGEVSQYYYPKQLPAGKTFDLLPSSVATNSDILSRFVQIDVSQAVTVYGPASGPKPTAETPAAGTQIDTGYGVHSAIEIPRLDASSWGCPVTTGPDAVANANDVANSSDAALSSGGPSRFRIEEM